ncbi:hypothetical protein GA0070607_0682 [Micromonospora coriariae]|uniref:Uncharacterized protein n=1 Tax=Micromonospora coriariae TaxID=285665 RepID=A0A1C4UIG3_9ACTN|nr:hypothetical protein [Micromonospora coriariae]SCE71462.1 hypothetical protein GA0070607_0682 [Micromonospora coriariae]
MTTGETETDLRVVTEREFLDELTSVTRERSATTFLYLMAQGDGVIGVQWEQPGVDHRRRYRVRDPGGPACPHCVVFEAVLALAPVLPLDLMRTARTRPQYETVLRTGQLPHLAFARPVGHPGASWLADCHAVTGDPHADADCPRHAVPAPSGDPLDVRLESLPRAVRQLYPHDAAATADLQQRLRIARDWRADAQAVASGIRAAAATWAFLRNSCLLGVPVPGASGLVLTLPPAGAPDDRPLAELHAAAVRALPTGGRVAYQERACLVPEPARGRQRMPSYAGALDLTGAAPVRTLRLPAPRRPLSTTGRGVLLLYEARHAMGRHVASAPERNDAYWESEAALNVFEFTVLERVAGRHYQEAVAAYLQALRREGDLLTRPHKVLDRRRRKALSLAFGGLDNEELRLWASVAYRNAILMLLGDLRAFAAHLRRQAA